MIVIVELCARNHILESHGQALGSIQAGLGRGLGMRSQLLALLQLSGRSDHTIRLDLGTSTNDNLQKCVQSQIL